MPSPVHKDWSWTTKYTSCTATKGCVAGSTELRGATVDQGLQLIDIGQTPAMKHAGLFVQPCDGRQCLRPGHRADQIGRPPPTEGFQSIDYRLA